MSDELRLAVAFGLAFSTTFLATPLAIRLAGATGFFDHPVGYKKHGEPTPYLGGTALLAGFAAAAVAFGDGAGELAPIVLVAAGLLVLGTIDDRVAVGPGIRVLVEAAAGVAIYAAGLGFSEFSAPVNFVLTVLFVLAVVNAFNLMDNLDGATGTVGGVSGAGLGVLSLAEGEPALAALSFALAGACAGFLPFNLSHPKARIFLGDGGSMPIGFIAAAVIMAIPGTPAIDWEMILIAVLLVGLPALDTTLVVVSRLRRGAGVLTGGRDHLTHRLLARLKSPRWVALVLGALQAALLTLGGLLYGAPGGVAFAGAAACILAGIAAVALLETPAWAPSGEDG